MESDSASRRRPPRLPIELKVEYRRLNEFFADYTRNISQGGAFIRTDVPLVVGTEMIFRMQVPRLAQPLSIRGEVRWVSPPHGAGGDDPGPRGEPGMGVRFLYDNAAQRREVASLVERLMRETLGDAIAAQLLETLAE